PQTCTENKRFKGPKEARKSKKSQPLSVATRSVSLCSRGLWQWFPSPLRRGRARHFHDAVQRRHPLRLGIPHHLANPVPPWRHLEAGLGIEAGLDESLQGCVLQMKIERRLFGGHILPVGIKERGVENQFVNTAVSFLTELQQADVDVNHYRELGLAVARFLYLGADFRRQPVEFLLREHNFLQFVLAGRLP